MPNGNLINTAASGSKAWWTGRRITVNPFDPSTPAGANNVRYTNPKTYFSSETSAVNGPCFNLSKLTRPMVSLDYWSDTELNRDGVVLQYSTDGGDNWRIVGPQEGQADRNEGVNWFNSLNVLGNPGNQAFGNYGWSGQETGVTNGVKGWKNARFNLDMIPPSLRDQVRIRIAFGSDGANALEYDGFAFDNFFIGDKKRNVLIEHFTNVDQPSLEADSYLNGLYAKPFYLRSSGEFDFTDIQYHLNQPQTDQLNLDNPVDPSARALYMGVQRAPFTITDGRFTSTSSILDLIKNLNLVEIDRRALIDPLFELTVDTTATGDPKKVRPVLSVKATKAFDQPLLVNVALVERSVGNSKNVLRKLLFGPDGFTINNPWTAGQSTFVDRGAIDINVPVVNGQNLKLVAFVQDKNSREIYQSFVLDMLPKQGELPVGVNEPLANQPLLKDIQLYPNPAKGSFYLSVPDGLTNEYSWKVSDQRGVVLKQGGFGNAVTSDLEIGVGELPNGIYFVVLMGPHNTIEYRKLVVLNIN
jgi:hypothetical protein